MRGINSLARATVVPSEGSPKISGSKFFVDVDDEAEFPSTVCAPEAVSGDRQAVSLEPKNPKKKLNKIRKQQAMIASVAQINELLQITETAPARPIESSQFISKFEDSESELE